MRGSSGKNALLILEGKFEGKKPRGRPDQEECGSTMYYRSWTRPNIKKLKGWQKIGRHGER